jgi:cobalt-zinc-cadmium efflux system outer membrane protein
MHFFSTYRRQQFILTIASLATLFGQEIEEIGDSPLTFAATLARVLEVDPRLALLEAQLEEAAGLADQAEFAPNPTLEAEVENILGTGPYEGTDAAETTITYAQELETAGKRRLRTEVAERYRETLRIGLEALRLRITSETRTAFDRVVLAQRRLELRKQELDLANQSLEETRRLLEAARVSAVETARAELAVRERNFGLRQAEREEVAAREALINLWGATESTNLRVADTVAVSEPPALAVIETYIEAHPELRQLEAGRTTRQAELELEEANATPNVEVFAGIRHTREDDGDTVFLVGVGLPLPLFDRNQGNIRVAHARIAALEAERETLRRELLLEVRSSWRELASAFSEAVELRETLLPAAEKALTQTREGYREGRYPLLNVLEGRQTLYDIQEAELEALERVIQARAALERLTATPLTNH